MKLSTRGRYAVMAMVDLVAQSSENLPIPLSQIAERQNIPVSYLEQLFGKLRKKGLVKSIRGPRGGYMVAKDPDQTRIADIILAVDEPIQATRCAYGSPNGCNADKSRCLTHDLWAELTNHIHLYLNSVSLSDILEKRILGSGGQVFRRIQQENINLHNLVT